MVAWEPVPLFAAFLRLGLLLSNMTHAVEVRVCGWGGWGGWVGGGRGALGRPSRRVWGAAPQRTHTHHHHRHPSSLPPPPLTPLTPPRTQVREKIVGDDPRAELTIMVPNRGIWGTAGVGGMNIDT